MTRNSAEGCPCIPCGLDAHLRKCHDSLYMMSRRLFIWTIQTVGTKQSGERGAVQFLPLLHQQLARTVTCEHESECLCARVGLVTVACYRVSSYKWEGTQCVCVTAMQEIGQISGEKMEWVLVCKEASSSSECCSDEEMKRWVLHSLHPALKFCLYFLSTKGSSHCTGFCVCMDVCLRVCHLHKCIHTCARLPPLHYLRRGSL